MAQQHLSGVARLPQDHGLAIARGKGGVRTKVRGPEGTVDSIAGDRRSGMGRGSGGRGGGVLSGCSVPQELGNP